MKHANKAAIAPTEMHWHAAGLTVLHGNDLTYLEAGLVGAMNLEGSGFHGLDSLWRTLEGDVSLVQRLLKKHWSLERQKIWSTALCLGPVRQRPFRPVRSTRTFRVPSISRPYIALVRLPGSFSKSGLR